LAELFFYEFLPFDHSLLLKNTTFLRSTQCLVHCLIYACSGGDSAFGSCPGFNESLLRGKCLGNTVAFIFVVVFTVIGVDEGEKIDPEMTQDDAGVVESKEVL